ncbi:MAG: septal ring lytic transglycosylase RlpA family protein [Beijerinckiaceae bacterium]
MASQAEASSSRKKSGPAVAGATQSGKASWYGPGFHGRRTASGEVFNTNSLTAAHKSLPFGTRVKVTSRATGRSVVVRINDRGPFVRGRVIDLSKASARAIGMAGLSDVTLSVL